MVSIVNYSGTKFSAGKYSQTLNKITLGGPAVSVAYENDYMFGVNIPGIPKADGGDRWRTAAVGINVGGFSVNLNMFTGDPDVNGIGTRYSRVMETADGKEYYYGNTALDPSMRAGVLSLGIGPFRFGVNSETVRHIFQNQFAHDMLMKGKSYQALSQQYDRINELYEQLLSTHEKLRQGANADAQQALSLLQQTRTELQRKEDELRALEASLNKEKANLEEMRIQNELKEKEIAEKNAKVAELEAILNAQDSVMKALKQKISDALVGFEGEGLSIYMKDGNVYVSLDEKLLFQSGKWDVDPKGQQALKHLGKVLENNQDINILIEGHTDNVPYGGSGNIQDNWDLSAKRATAIVKILLSNSTIDPTRLTAAGRGPYIPIDTANTSEARAKNRRTEIILTPKLNTLYDIVNQ